VVPSSVSIDRPIKMRMQPMYCNLPTPEESCSRIHHTRTSRYQSTSTHDSDNLMTFLRVLRQNRNKCKKPRVEHMKPTHLEIYSNLLLNAVFKLQIAGICSFPFVSSFANFSIWLYGIAVFNLYTHRKRRFLLHRKLHISWERALPSLPSPRLSL
jgi:hypothetical protein